MNEEGKLRKIVVAGRSIFSVHFILNDIFSCFLILENLTFSRKFSSILSAVAKNRNESRLAYHAWKKTFFTTRRI